MADTDPLTEVLAEFARTMVTDFPIQAILDRLVERIVEVLAVSAAGVTLISPGATPVQVAASNTAALRSERHPPTWRRVSVRAGIPLPRLHDVVIGRSGMHP